MCINASYFESRAAIAPPHIISLVDDTGFPFFNSTYSDLRTMDQNVTLRGTSSGPGLNITMYSAANQVGSAISIAGGNWTIVTAVLSAGLHEFQATAASGQSVSVRSSTFTISVEPAPMPPPPFTAVLLDDVTYNNGPISAALNHNLTIACNFTMDFSQHHCPDPSNCAPNEFAYGLISDPFTEPTILPLEPNNSSFFYSNASGVQTMVVSVANLIGNSTLGAHLICCDCEYEAHERYENELMDC